MKISKKLAILLLAILILSSWAPAQAATGASAPASGPIVLTIVNPLPKATTVTLTGPQALTIRVSEGGSVQRTISAGKYQYSYQGCLGKTKTGNLKIKGATGTLSIPACKMATWVFYNLDKKTPFTLTLKGWMTYNVTVAPGGMQIFNWVAGEYDATVKVCGRTYYETWKIKGKKGWDIFACKD